MGAAGNAGFWCSQTSRGAECIFSVLSESTALLSWCQERARDSSHPQREPSGEGCSSENKAFLSSSDLLLQSELARGVQTATGMADTHKGPVLGSSSLPWGRGLGLPWSGDLQTRGSSPFRYC